MSATSKPAIQRQGDGGQSNPAMWGGVPPRNADFTGRDDLLEQVRELLCKGTTIALSCALHGEGGAGKTQLALEYVYRYAADYDLIWWIPADDPTIIERRLIELGQVLGVPTSSDNREAIAAIFRKLTEDGPYARTLLVFDNAPQPAKLRGLIPQSSSGKMLITSRHSEWSTQAPSIDVKPGPATRNKLFVCYSRADSGLLEEIRVQLTALKRVSSIETFDDTQIPTGKKWLERIRQALASTRVALLLVSPDFLASRFVMEEEVPAILKAAEEEGVVVLCLIVRPSLFKRFEALSQFQTVNAPDKPLSQLRKFQRERALVALAETIEAALTQQPGVTS